MIKIVTKEVVCMSINISLFTCTPGLVVQAFINMHYADEIIGNNRWLNDKSKLVIDIKKNNSILNLLKQRRFQHCWKCLLFIARKEIKRLRSSGMCEAHGFYEY